jgi:hypothetical protein
LRTLQEPFPSAERTKFQPCAVGVIKMDFAAVSILKLLPANQLRNIARFSHYHPHGASNVA